MDRVSIGPVNGLRFAVVAFVLSVFLFAAMFGGGAYLLIQRNEDVADSAAELRDALVHACKANPLRRAEVEDQREALVDPADPRYRELLPNVPRSVIDRIATETNVRHRERIREIRSIDCEARYPSP